MIAYRMEIVGGPFDGAGGMRWRDDGEHPPPKAILMGVCPGDGSCSAHQAASCARRGKRHPYYWIAGEATVPPGAVEYGLQESFVEPDTNGPPDVTGRAIYAIGGLELPRRRELHDIIRDGNERELVPAGGVYASDVVREIARKHGIRLGGRNGEAGE